VGPFRLRLSLSSFEEGERFHGSSIAQALSRARVQTSEFCATKALPIRDVLVTQQVGDAAQDHDPVLVVGPLLVSRFGCIEARWSQVRMLVARRSRTFHLW
jgi:hypothetical protein